MTEAEELKILTEREELIERVEKRIVAKELVQIFIGVVVFFETIHVWGNKPLANDLVDVFLLIIGLASLAVVLAGFHAFYYANKTAADSIDEKQKK